MLPENLKADVLDIADIAKACPAHLQERCFEVLLNYYLTDLAQSSENDKKCTDKEVLIDKSDEFDEAEVLAKKNKEEQDEEIEIKDLHIKARKFLEKYAIDIQDINQILYKKEDDFLPLYEELKSTKTAECQTRIGLLQALVSGLKTGDFQFNGEEMRRECQDRKCYDPKNFTANLSNSTTLFEGFEKYDKAQPMVRLSELGRKKLAGLIAELK